MATKISMRGLSGDQYSFTAHDSPNSFRAVPAVYMIAGRAVGGWKILYVGECSDLKNFFSNSEIWNEAVQWFGATHILVYSASRNEAARKRIERDLVLVTDPVMNVGKRTSSSYAK